MLKKALKLIFAFILVLSIAPQKAYAYLDPGTGSYLIQIIIASVAGAGYLIKANWGRIRAILSKKNKKEEKDEKEDK